VPLWFVYPLAGWGLLLLAHGCCAGVLAERDRLEGGLEAIMAAAEVLAALG